MKSLTRVLFLWATLLAVFGHEVSTHVKIGDAAVVYLNLAYPSRPLLSGFVTALQGQLHIGAIHEDDAFGPNLGGYNPYGRFIFHFTPSLDFGFPTYPSIVSANGCSSENWGQSISTPEAPNAPNGFTGCAASCYVPGTAILAVLGWLAVAGDLACSEISGIKHTNSYRWDQDLTSDNTGAPSMASVQSIGYVLHLLEDLGSPPHTRNDLHACPLDLAYCDEFEKFNEYAKYAPYGDPFCIPLGGTSQTPLAATDCPGTVWKAFVAATTPASGAIMQVIPTAGFAAPAQFFDALQLYVSENYYSNRTVFQGAGPQPMFSDANYFYGACITSLSGVKVSEIAGTCQPVQNPVGGQTSMVRKIAHKSILYWNTCTPPISFNDVGCDRTKADVDQTIAREQFAELGPVIAQHVAAFLQFYAPALTVQIQGSGIGTVTSSPDDGINCSSGACSALFVQAQNITETSLTANAAPGSVFTNWSGGGCSGNVTTCIVTMNSDRSVTAIFSLLPAQQYNLTTATTGTGTGTVSASSSSPSLSCGANCLSFAAGSVVILTAAENGSTFTGWSVSPASAGSCPGTGSCTVTMNSNVSVTATFNISSSGGADSVTQSITLSPVGGCSGGSASASISVTAPAGVTWSATFVPTVGIGTFNVSPASGTGSGTVNVKITALPQSPTEGFTCSSTYSLDYYGTINFVFSNGKSLNSNVDYTYIFVN